MKLSEQVLNQHKPVSTEGTVELINRRLDSLGFEGIWATDASYDEQGHIFISFVDDEDSEMEVTFLYDQEEGAIAVIGDEEDEDEYGFVIYLDALLPSIEKTIYGDYINVNDTSWMNSSFFYSLMQSGDLEDETDVLASVDSENGLFERLDERSFNVIRGGKRVKLAVVRKKKRKLMTGAQRSALRAGARKRKQMKGKINRKRKRSLAIRKRMNIKKPKLGRFQKLSGQSNFKRR